MADTPNDLLADLLRRDAAAPLLTFYDDGTGERTELSGATVANWMAKTANLLVDEIGLGERADVAICLPVHWQSVVLALAAWSTGAQVTLAAEPGGAPELLVIAETDLDAVTVDAGTVLALSLRPMNAGLTQPRPGVVDYAAEVLAQGDRFVPYSPVDPDAPAAHVAGQTLSGRELAALAEQGASGRVLSVLPLHDPAGLRAALAPLSTGSGVVLCANADPAALANRCATEQATATVGVTVEGIPST